jgi:hypothetical protein
MAADYRGLSMGWLCMAAVKENPRITTTSSLSECSELNHGDNNGLAQSPGWRHDIVQA